MGIVTLACNVGQHRAVSFHMIGVHGDRAFLVDLRTDWNGYASVIDAAREVFHYCNATYGSTGIVCDDVDLGWREITCENGAMSDEPYRDSVPFKVAWKHLTAQQRNSPAGGG